jgi:hypothetical protein
MITMEKKPTSEDMQVEELPVARATGARKRSQAS